MRRGCEVESEASKAERKVGEAEWQIFGGIRFVARRKTFRTIISQMPLKTRKSRRILLSLASILSRQTTQRCSVSLFKDSRRMQNDRKVFFLIEFGQNRQDE
jgi:hypothetical protein